ncbi:hypothetical protein AN958_12787 [Leucoagaricus sp. SymC.cos]|nr:hypothetical protein AN958_12787 [Leucoagaricus sp. SymC.cos]
MASHGRFKGLRKPEEGSTTSRPHPSDFQAVSHDSSHHEYRKVNTLGQSHDEDAYANETTPDPITTSLTTDCGDHDHPKRIPIPMCEEQHDVKALIEGDITLTPSRNSRLARRASFNGRHPIIDSPRAPTLGTPSLQAGPGAFSNAHNFRIGTANMIDITQNFNLQNTIFDHLEKKGLLSAMLDSQERSYPPRCNLETRRSLRGHIVQWGGTMNHAPDLGAMWLSGPAGVIKSAVAQTVAETFKEDGLLGAAFFFSRPNRREDPDTLIPTLAYQLAIHDHRYKDIIARQLADDPSILSQHRRAQFKALIIDPLQLIMNDTIAQQHPNTTLRPLLVVIDGLDECASPQAQREFVRIIADYAGKVDGLGYPLRWDAIRLLESGFAEIRETYGPDRLPADWPPSSDQECIAKAASGHLGFVSLTIRFIGDENYDDSHGQLENCLQFLGGSGAPGALNPLHALDLLYAQILSSIPATDLQNAMRILGSTILYGGTDLTVLIQANFLGLNQDTFYRALQ